MREGFTATAAERNYASAVEELNTLTSALVAYHGERQGERDIEYDAYRYLAPISPAGLCASETQRLYYFKDSGIRDFCTGATNDEQDSVLQPITFADLDTIRTFSSAAISWGVRVRN